MLQTYRPLGPEVRFSSMYSRKFMDTSGPKSQKTCSVDVRAKARTYPRASSSYGSLGDNQSWNPRVDRAQHLPRYAAGKICEIPRIDRSRPLASQQHHLIADSHPGNAAYIDHGLIHRAP